MDRGSRRKTRDKLMNIYNKMYEHFGSRGWWPGETVFEICVGAILTQSVAWKNVVKAIDNLKDKGLCDLPSMYNCPREEIEKCIVPTMYYRMKAKKLKSFVTHVTEKYRGNLQEMLAKDLPELRKELLAIYGIGPETADSIILYAAEKPIFVVDAYTRRIFSRLGCFAEEATYDQMQRYFMDNLPPDTRLYNEFHALIVGVGNKYCGNRKTRCGECPVREFCKHDAAQKTENINS